VPNQGWSPTIWLEFDAQGIIDAGAAAGLTKLMDAPGIEDLLVISHGWKNDKNDATKLYGTLWKNTCDNLPSGKAERIVVAGVLWPAKTFRTDFDEDALATVQADGTLAVSGSGVGVADLSEERFNELLNDFRALMGASGEPTIKAARTAGDGLTLKASQALVRQGVAAVDLDPQSPDPELVRDASPIAAAAAEPIDAHDLLLNLSRPPQLRLTPAVGNTMGLGSAVQGLVQGSRAAVGRFLNQLTYYEMKKRAGIVGVSLTNTVLISLTPKRPIRLHLVGHSFGGRLMTAAANEWTPSGQLELYSLTILQGAYSHHALAGQAGGAFPSVIGKPSGPIAITHTHNDLACTVAYALASRLSRDTTTALGDASDEYGAMGANGPQRLQEGVAELDNTNQDFAPKRGKINTFLADAYVIKTKDTDAHNNITNPTVGRLLARTILA
jgi:hypothetical protein